MRRAVALCLALFSVPALAQAPGGPMSPLQPVMPPAPQLAPPVTADPGAGASGTAQQQGYGGCNGCSYSGDYFGSGWGPNSAPPRRPAPPPRIQGRWRNGWWYY
jgi:hypothetical protein